MVAKQTKIDWGKPKDEISYPPNHNFDETPIVEGTLVREGMVTVREKEVFLIILDTSKGEETIWLGAVLESSLALDKPVIGDYVGIKYLGMKKGASGFRYRDFDTRVIRKEVE